MLSNTLAFLTARGAQLPDEEPLSRLEAIQVAGGDRYVVSFDDTTSEQAIWTIPNWPDAYQGTGTLKAVFQGIMESATSGDVDLDVQVEAITPGDLVDLRSTLSFDAVNSSDNNIVPGTAGHMFEIEVTLTNKDAVIPGDHVRLRVARDAASDTATGDFRILGATIHEELSTFDITGFDEVHTSKVGIGETTLGATAHIQTPDASTKGQIIKLSAAQSANAFEVQNSSGTVYASITPSALVLTGDDAAIFDVQSSANDPIFKVNTSFPGSATGIEVTSAVAGGNAIINTLSSLADESLWIQSKGAGELVLRGGNTSTPIRFRVDSSFVARFTSDSHFESSDSQGWRLRNEGSSATQPTLIPNRGSVQTGWGGTSGTISGIISSEEAFNIDTSLQTSLKRGSITGGGTDNKILDLTATLNAPSPGGTNTFRGIKVTATQTDIGGWQNVYLADLMVGANSIFRVKSAVNAATGIEIRSGAASSGVSINALSSSANETIRVSAKGTGGVELKGSYIEFSNISPSLYASLNNTGFIFNVNLLANNETGPAIRDIASVSTTPVLCPRKNQLTYGIGGGSSAVSIIAGGVEALTVDQTTNVMVKNSNASLVLPLANDAITPTLAFGDGDTGIFESTDDVFNIATAQVVGWSIGIARRITHTASLTSAANEVAHTINYTVNKSGGNDTGLLIAQTDTASPGVSLPFDITVGGSSRFSIENTARITATELAGDPGTIPGTNRWHLYFKPDGLHYMDDAGVTTGPLSINVPGGSNGDLQYNNNGSFGGFGDWDGSRVTIPAIIVQSDDAAAMDIREAGGNSILKVDTSVANANTGFVVVPTESNGARLEVQSAMANESLHLVPKGTGSNIATGTIHDSLNNWALTSSAPSALFLSDDSSIRFTNGTNWTDTVDAGIQRSAPNVIRITNGSTGWGCLTIGANHTNTAQLEITGTTGLVAAKFTGNGTEDAVKVTGNSTLTGNVTMGDAAGPAILNEAASSTNPTICPNRADLTTGWSATAATMYAVRSGATKLQIDSSLTAFADLFGQSPNSFRIYPNLNASGTVVTVAPNRGASTSGLGGVAGTISLITNSLGRVHIANDGTVGINQGTPGANQLNVTAATGNVGLLVTGNGTEDAVKVTGNSTLTGTLTLDGSTHLTGTAANTVLRLDLNAADASTGQWLSLRRGSDGYEFFKVRGQAGLGLVIEENGYGAIYLRTNTLGIEDASANNHWAQTRATAYADSVNTQYNYYGYATYPNVLFGGGSVKTNRSLMWTDAFSISGAATGSVPAPGALCNIDGTLSVNETTQGNNQINVTAATGNVGLLVTGNNTEAVAKFTGSAMSTTINAAGGIELYGNTNTKILDQAWDNGTGITFESTAPAFQKMKRSDSSAYIGFYGNNSAIEGNNFRITDGFFQGALAGINNTSGDVRLNVSRTGTGAGQTVSLITQRYAENDDHPNLQIAANGIDFGIRDGSTWNEGIDSISLSIAPATGNVHIGNGVTASSPTAGSLNGTGGSGTDIAGANLQIAGGKGTGNAAGGDILFQTSDAGGSGTTLQSLTTKMKLGASNGLSIPKKAITLGSAATTFAVTSNVMVITGDGGANTIATITGASDGMKLTLIFVDSLVTITDDDSHDPDTIDLNSAFTGEDDAVLELIFDGTSWYEVTRNIGHNVPGGADTQVQFNDGGSFGGDSGLVYNKTTNVMTISGATAIGEGCLVFNSAATGVYDSNLVRLGDNSHTGGFIFGATAAFGSTNGPYFGGRGNNYSAIANQAGIMFFSSGNKGGAGDLENQIRMFSGDGGESLGLFIHKTGKVGFGGGTDTSEPGAQAAVTADTGNVGLLVTGNGTEDAVSIANTGGNALVAHAVKIGKNTLGGASATDNFLNVTGTFPTVISATTSAVKINITSAGSSSKTQEALRVTLASGYTGTSPTYALDFENLVAGTASDLLGAASGNIGSYGAAWSTTTGDNCGVFGNVNGGNRNYGVIGYSIQTKNSATNVGVAGIGRNAGSSPVQVGGYFALKAENPTFVSAALIADNRDQTDPIFLARDNGVTKFQIADGGLVGINVAPGANQLNVTAATGNVGLLVTGNNTEAVATFTGSGKTASVNAAGDFTNTGGESSSEVFGAGAAVTSSWGTAIGNSAACTGTQSVAVGTSTNAGGRGVAVGWAAVNSAGSGVAIGMQATAGANEFVSGSASYPVNSLYFGKGVTNATPTAYTIHGTGGSGTDIAGGNLQIAGGKGTGNASGGDILFQTSDAGGSGTTLQSLTTKATLTAAGRFGVNVASPTTAQQEITAATGNVGLLVTGNGTEDALRVTGLSRFTGNIETENASGPSMIDGASTGSNASVRPNRAANSGLGSSSGTLTIVSAGVGQFSVTSAIYSSNANGSMVYNRAATATVPTLIPNRASDTGLGGVAGTIGGIVTGSQKWQLNSAGMSTPKASITLGAGVTTFAVTSNVMIITGDGGANTIATITGASDGMRLTLIFVDGLVTITDDDTHAADTVDLSAAFTSADDMVLELIYDGTSWYEINRSAN